MTLAAHNLSQRFPGRRAFITGAASGLGLACAETLAREGWRLALTDVDAPRLDLVAQSLARDGAPVLAAPCDVRDGTALGTLVDRAAEALGGLDASIHCAGVAAAGPFHASTEDEWRWVFDINVHGVANASRAAIRHMARGRGGLIVNVASAAGFCTGTHMAAYNASKAAVIALSESLMQEYADYGVQVVAAMPGFFRTRLIEGARGNPKTLESARRLVEDSGIEAAQVAEAMLWAASRGRTHFVYPGRYATLWRLKRLMPQRFQRLLPRLLGRGPRRASDGDSSNAG
jgi:NAD(P)-dependent dehydrogenase (short-subunit alcohol dehydrogenase family)